MQEHDRSGSSLQFMSVVESEVRDVVEGASFTSQRVLMVPLDKVAIILQFAGSPFKSSSTENISVIFTN